MNETSPKEPPITWPDLAVTATLSRVSSIVDRYSLQVAGRERATLLVLRDSLSGLVDLDFTDDPDDQVLLAVGRLLHAHVRTRRNGRANK